MATAFTHRGPSRAISSAVQLVSEDTILCSSMGGSSGMVVPPLKVFDEVSLTLGCHGIVQRERYVGKPVELDGLVDKNLVETRRGGKAAGGGFYDYQDKKRKIWTGLSQLITSSQR